MVYWESLYLIKCVIHFSTTSKHEDSGGLSVNKRYLIPSHILPRTMFKYLFYVTSLEEPGCIILVFQCPTFYPSWQWLQQPRHPPPPEWIELILGMCMSHHWGSRFADTAPSLPETLPGFLGNDYNELKIPLLFYFVLPKPSHCNTLATHEGNLLIFHTNVVYNFPGPYFPGQGHT